MAKKSAGFFLVLLILIIILIPTTIAANPAQMESSRYKIQMPSINSEAGKMTSDSNINLSTTLGELVAGEFARNGYIVKAGFQYIHSIIPFTFTVSNANINFGELQPYQPATASANLIVSFGGEYKYSVSAIAQTRFQTLNGLKFIPDTQCDPGKSCSKTTANLWIAATTEGFGYNMLGEDIPNDFLNFQYYRPFPIQNLGDEPQIIMENNDVTLKSARPYTHQSTIVFKTNIGPLQAAGTYQTIINFIATAGY